MTENTLPIYDKSKEDLSEFAKEKGYTLISLSGKNSFLISTDQGTNFVYEITGPIDQKLADAFNNSSSVFRDRLSFLDQCSIQYRTMENSTFKNNLILIDSDLPKIVAELLKLYYMDGYTTVSSAVKQLTRLNPMGYDLACGHPFYEYKVKKLLIESALGMVPATVWRGRFDATGGYIIVREDGEILCYHLFNINDFEDWLLNNTRMEKASTHRYDFGQIYKKNGKFYIKFNLQIRFKK